MNAIYARVSTDEQAQHGYSLQDQLCSCRNRLLSMGFTTIKEYIDEGYSGEYLERPGLDDLRKDLRTGLIENICVYDPDRLSRNLVNQLLFADEIEHLHAKLLFVTGDYDASPEGRLFFSMRGAISAFEKAKIKERTMRGRLAKANSGKIVINAKPYGYGWDAANSMYIVNETEATVVRMIYAMCINHRMGASVITKELQNLGVLGRNGKPLSATTVDKILTRDLYWGQHYLYRQKCRKTGQNTREIINLPKENWIPISVPAIVTKQEFDKVQQQRQKNKQLAKRNCRHEYLLQGILKCALCGRSLMGTTRPYKRRTMQDKLYSYYVCVTKESNAYQRQRCRCRRIPVDSFDNTVWQAFVKLVCDYISINNYLITQQFPDYRKQIAQFQSDINKLLNQREDIVKWYREKLLDSQTTKSQLTKINNELTYLTSKMNALQASEDKIKKPVNISPAELLSAITIEQKRKILLKCGLMIYAVRLPHQDQTIWKLKL